MSQNTLLSEPAQLVRSLAAPNNVPSCVQVGGLGSISGADHLDSGFHPSGVSKMSSSQYMSTGDCTTEDYGVEARP